MNLVHTDLGLYEAELELERDPKEGEAAGAELGSQSCRMDPNCKAKEGECETEGRFHTDPKVDGIPTEA